MKPLSAQRLLGFDIRLSPEASAAEIWSESLRASQLIDPSIAYPISVDEGAWSKVDEATYRGAISTAADSWGMRPFEIENLGVRLLNRVPMEWLTEKMTLWRGAWLIAVSASREEFSDLQRDFGADYIAGFWQDLDLESLADLGWSLLGYDVAGRTGGISGLCGTGFSTSGRAEVIQFKSNLGAHGLFSDLHGAEEFAAIRERQMPEHAPLRPFGIWSSPRNRALAEIG